MFPEIDYDQIDTVPGLNISHHHDRDDRREGQGAAQDVQFPVSRT